VEDVGTRVTLNLVARELAKLTAKRGTLVEINLL